MKRMSLLGASLGLLMATPVLAEIVVEDPYVRAMPPGQPNTAAFMQLHNTGSEARAVVEARSAASNVVELHTHVHEDGMMRMRQIEQIDLPAGEPVSLQPGGLHVMLIDLVAPLSVGERVGVTLVLDNGEEIAVDAEVRHVERGMGHSRRHHH